MSLHVHWLVCALKSWCYPSSRSKWESAKRAAGWMISNANNTYGLPQKLATTYDHFGFRSLATVMSLASSIRLMPWRALTSVNAAA